MMNKPSEGPSPPYMTNEEIQHLILKGILAMADDLDDINERIDWIADRLNQVFPEKDK